MTIINLVVYLLMSTLTTIYTNIIFVLNQVQSIHGFQKISYNKRSFI